MTRDDVAEWLAVEQHAEALESMPLHERPGYLDSLRPSVVVKVAGRMIDARRQLLRHVEASEVAA